MPTLTFPDGTSREVSEQEVAAAVRGGAFFSNEPAAAEAEQSGPSVLEDPVGSANALLGGAARGATLVMGDSLWDGVSELVSQSLDDYSWQNRLNESMQQHSGLTTAGRIMGNIGAGVTTQASIPNAFTGLGAFGGAAATAATEGAIIMGIDRGGEQLTEDMLERPDISGEQLAANALLATLQGGVMGAALGGIATGAGMGLARGVRGANRMLTGAADDAVESSVQAFGRSTDNLDDVARAESMTAAARTVDADPTSPLAQAVRRAEREGVDNMVSRVYRESVDEIRTATRAANVVADIPESMVRASAPNGMLDAQIAGTNLVVARAQQAHEALVSVATTEADRAALSTLNMARQRAIMGGEFTAAGNTAGEISRQLTASNRLSASLDSLSPQARQVVAEYVGSAEKVFSDESVFGTLASNATRVSEATRVVNALRQAVESGHAPSIDELRTASKAADTIAESFSRGGSKNGARVVQRAERMAEQIRGALSRVEDSSRVAELSRALQNSADAPSLGRASRLEEWAARAVGAKLGGPFGAMVAPDIYRAIRETGYKRAVLWRAQNAYATFRNRTAESLLKFTAHPRPAVQSLEFSVGAYQDAVDAVKRAADIPVNPRARVQTEIVGQSSFVKQPVHRNIPMARGRDLTPEEMAGNAAAAQSVADRARSAAQRAAENARSATSGTIIPGSAGSRGGVNVQPGGDVTYSYKYIDELAQRLHAQSGSGSWGDLSREAKEALRDRALARIRQPEANAVADSGDIIVDGSSARAVSVRAPAGPSASEMPSIRARPAVSASEMPSVRAKPVSPDSAIAANGPRPRSRTQRLDRDSMSAPPPPRGRGSRGAFDEYGSRGRSVPPVGDNRALAGLAPKPRTASGNPRNSTYDVPNSSDWWDSMIAKPPKTRPQAANTSPPTATNARAAKGVRDSGFYGPNAQKSRQLQNAVGRDNGVIVYHSNGWWHVNKSGERIFLGANFDDALATARGGA